MDEVIGYSCQLRLTIKNMHGSRQMGGESNREIYSGLVERGELGGFGVELRGVAGARGRGPGGTDDCGGAGRRQRHDRTGGRAD